VSANNEDLRKVYRVWAYVEEGVEDPSVPGEVGHLTVIASFVRADDAADFVLSLFRFGPYRPS
jgi:hypothetical protein